MELVYVILGFVAVFALVCLGYILFFLYRDIRLVATGKFTLDEIVARNKIILEKQRSEKPQKPKKVKRNRNYLWFLLGGLAFFGDSHCVPGTGSC